jgi:hypothetical protein
MRFANTLVSAAMALGLAACGAPDKQSKNDDGAQAAPTTDEEKKAQLEQDFAEIPNAAIVRVPVDADGNVTGEPEMMTYKGSEDLETVESAEKAFAAGAAPQKLIASQDELDGDSSTQSWTAWTNYSSSYGNGYGNSYGNSYGNGYGSSYGNRYGNSYGSSWNYNYWSTSYKPVLYYKRPRLELRLQVVEVVQPRWLQLLLLHVEALLVRLSSQSSKGRWSRYDGRAETCYPGFGPCT